MKTLYIALLAGMVAFTTSSCEKWLDIQPSDEVIDKDLFAEGTGYRNALNGIYRQASSDALYGSRLTWGVVEAMAQQYDDYNFSGHVWAEFADFKYTSDDAKAQIEATWKMAYSAISNCNNLIANVTNAPNKKFQGGQLERELILGEAYAMRGFLHFVVLSYFAPAPIKNSTQNWIPYHDKFPTTAASYLTVDATLKRIIEDLKQGIVLVEPFDTYYVPNKENYRDNLYYLDRFIIESGFKDIFYAFRGYRMNVTAIMAILARVYSYAGEHDLAAAEAQKVINFNINPPEESTTLAFKFTSRTEAENDYKMSPDLIFALANETLVADYAAATQPSQFFSLTMAYNFGDNFDSNTDYRKTVLLKGAQNGYDFSPRRYTIPMMGGDADILDILPVIRLSEMYYIQAEAFAAKGDYTNATAMLEVVRKARECGPGLLNGKITDAKTFSTEMINEARREFTEEGLTFYYHKKYDTKFFRSMKDEAFYFPLPETETVQ